MLLMSMDLLYVAKYRDGVLIKKNIEMAHKAEIYIVAYCDPSS